MRLVTVKAPEGNAERMAQIAFKHEISQVNVGKQNALVKNGVPHNLDVIEFAGATPRAKGFIEELMQSSFYDPRTFSFTLREPESIFATEPPEEETVPYVRPSTDVYEELWQFSRITISLVARVFLSSLLLAYGMREGYMPLIIAGLLFLPFHHVMLGMAAATGVKDSRLFKQSFLAFLISTLCIVAAGVCIGILMEPPIKFTAFTSPPLVSFLLSAVIGAAAGFGSMDDAGRRELIGLAATAHISVYPIWFGLKFMYGFDPADKPVEYLLIFLMDVTTLTLCAGIVMKLSKLHGKGIRNFLKFKKPE